jgi:threonine aldolase
MKSPVPAHSFASDNSSGVHPAVMDALARVNHGHVLAYGEDRYTTEAIETFRELFDAPNEVLFCWGGTGANMVGLHALLRSFQAVICATSAHINVDECGAAEWMLGTKLIDLETPDAKLTPEQVQDQMHILGDEHHAQPGALSITQSTEMGTVYTLDEIGALAATAHGFGLTVHLDGARIANACAATATHPHELREAGVDVLTFGATKNGGMYGEAVVFLEPSLAQHARFLRKQNAQLPSKMRYIAAQFSALLDDDLWLDNAKSANTMARRLYDTVKPIEGLDLSPSPTVNAVFARLDRPAVETLQAWSYFSDWDRARDEVRWMCSFDTTIEDVDRFAAGIAEALA